MSTTNTNLLFQGNPLTVEGKAIATGQWLPSFKLTANDLSDISSDQFKGKVLVLSVVPSLDTPTCSLQTKRFNQEATDLGPNCEILTVSMDLPFAQARWCGAEGITRVRTASDYKYRSFAKDFGVWLPDVGLMCRAVFIADSEGKIQYVDYVDNLSSEPDYAPILKKIREFL